VSFIFEIKRFRYISFYNLAWTSFPLIIKALFDKDFYYKKWTGVGDEKAGKISEEYKDNLKTPSKNPDSSPEGIPRPPSRTPGRISQRIWKGEIRTSQAAAPIGTN
jgi:hypothetical protein